MRTLLRGFLDSFTPLRIRSLRLYLGGQAISLFGTWMQSTAQSWVVWRLSHSTAALGTVAMLGWLPLFFLGPWAGVWADRLDRRRVLIWTQATAMLLAFALAILVQTDVVRLWHVYLLATALGCISALDFPAQQAFVGDLSGMDQVRKAVVINNMAFQASRMAGPSLAGLVIGTLGEAPAFWINGLSFVAVLASLLSIRGMQRDRPVVTGAPLHEFWEGMKFVGQQPRIQDLMFFTMLATFFGISNLQILPAFATDVLHRGPEELGLLMGASGAGALCGAIFLVPMVQRLRHTGKMLGFTTIWIGTWYIIFSRSIWLPLSLACLFLSGGIAIPVVMTTINGLLQTLAPPQMRARLLSNWNMLSFGLQPMAALMVGYVGQFFGAPAAVLINGALMVMGGLYLLVLRPGLRQWEPVAQREESREKVPA